MGMCRRWLARACKLSFRNEYGLADIVRRGHPCFCTTNFWQALVFRPARGHDLRFGVELDAIFAEGMQVTKEGTTPPGEWEDGCGSGNSNVHADHSGLHL